MFRELIGTVPQEQSVLKVLERILAERTLQPCRIMMKTVKLLTENLTILRCAGPRAEILMMVGGSVESRSEKMKSRVSKRTKHADVELRGSSDEDGQRGPSSHHS